MIVDQEVAALDEETTAGDFATATEPFRRELVAHCYRMLGSAHDAEDIVQETYLRAWRGWAGFAGRSSVRTWLHRIATNACLSALRHSSRRVLPSGLGAPADGPDEPMHPADRGVTWLQPLPTALVAVPGADPAEIAAARAGLRLALVAGLQHLPPRQRAVLLLRDVLELSAAETALVLDMSVVAVKSALQRARARLAEVAPRLDATVEPDEPAARAVLDRYVDAFQRADADALEALLRADATLEVVGTRTWFAGKRTCAPYLRRHVLLAPDEYRMVVTSANGQPAAAAFRRNPATSAHEPFAVVVVGTDGRQITGITLFPGLETFAAFADPAAVP